MKRAMLFTTIFLIFSISTLANKSETPATILIERGTFTMGDTWENEKLDEGPAHRVEITYDFYMGVYEVTFQEYDIFCDRTNRSKPDDRSWGRESRPVINVSWWDAIAYCNWLSEKESLPVAYDGEGNLLDGEGKITTNPSRVVGYRLPTEAEWEYAARGGNRSGGYMRAGSNNVSEVAWYKLNSQNKTHEVGTKMPNELGLYDMSGNVWEWTGDWYEFYSSSNETDPYNATVASYRVTRGGSWIDCMLGVRVSYRGSSLPTHATVNLGFRIARTAL